MGLAIAVSAKRFIKSSGTAVPIGNSQRELERVLRRYGANAFGVSSDYDAGVIKVFFRAPEHLNSPASIPVRLEVNVGGVYLALFGHKHPGQKERGPGWAQAERVAWRQLVLWVDAALSASAAGLQPISEAFLAHTLVRGSDGLVRRMIDEMNLQSGGNWQLRLPPGDA